MFSYNSVNHTLEFTVVCYVILSLAGFNSLCLSGEWCWSLPGEIIFLYNPLSFFDIRFPFKTGINFSDIKSENFNIYYHLIL